ncbi:MAG: hypothetical protein IJV07_02615, partial [Alphaproteobacteria bacterium]|nr:hypothetical protein [Alphaproteobacteria bacterium]
MNKIILFSLLLFGLTAKAQMTDLLGSLSLQGTITQQSTQSVAGGLKVENRLKILQDIQQVAIEIKTMYMGNYTGINSSSVSGSPFSGMNWNINSLSSSRFFIQLNKIDKETCSYLLSVKTGAIKTEVN